MTKPHPQRRQRPPTPQAQAHARQQKQQQKTRASIQQAWRNNCQLAVNHIRSANAADSVAETDRELAAAVVCLERCLAVQPGDHLLRRQFQACQRALRNLRRGDQDVLVEVFFDPDQL